MPNNFEIHSHDGRHWYSIHEPDSWALIIASPAVHDTPDLAVAAAVRECINLARVAERHGHKMESALWRPDTRPTRTAPADLGNAGP